METLATEVKDFWSYEREMLAVIAEILHSLLVVTIKANSKKGTQTPPPLHIPRPHEAEREEIPALTMGEYLKNVENK